MKKTIISIDDDSYWPEYIGLLLKKLLRAKGIDLTMLSADSAETAAEKIKEVGVENILLAISDGKLLGLETAIEVHNAMRTAGYQGKIILFTCDTKELGQIAATKNYSLLNMFFDQVEKSHPKKLVEAVIRATAD